MRKLDLSGLDGPVGLGEVSDYYRRHRTGTGQKWWAIAIIVAVYLIGQAAFIAFLLPAVGLDDALERAVLSGFLVVTGLYAALMMAVIWRNAARPVRLDRTASANGLRYDDRQPPGVAFVGSVPTHSSFTFATDILRGGGTRSDAGADQDFVAATMGPRPGTTLRRSGFVQIRLDRQTPHIVLENRRAGVLATTGRAFRGAQRLSLEGDFDRTFALYCPTGYETDALYIFTPDLMALMLDLAGDCEAELIDGYLVVYSGRPWRLWKPERFAALLVLVDALGAKARRQTGRYVDWRRTDAEAIGATGRRLRVRPSVGGVLATAVPLAFVAYGLWSGIRG